MTPAVVERKQQPKSVEVQEILGEAEKAPLPPLMGLAKKTTAPEGTQRSQTTTERLTPSQLAYLPDAETNQSRLAMMVGGQPVLLNEKNTNVPVLQKTLQQLGRDKSASLSVTWSKGKERIPTRIDVARDGKKETLYDLEAASDTTTGLSAEGAAQKVTVGRSRRIGRSVGKFLGSWAEPAARIGMAVGYQAALFKFCDATGIDKGSNAFHAAFQLSFIPLYAAYDNVKDRALPALANSTYSAMSNSGSTLWNRLAKFMRKGGSKKIDQLKPDLKRLGIPLSSKDIGKTEQAGLLGDEIKKTERIAKENLVRVETGKKPGLLLKTSRFQTLLDDSTTDSKALKRLLDTLDKEGKAEIEVKGRIAEGGRILPTNISQQRRTDEGTQKEPFYSIAEDNEKIKIGGKKGLGAVVGNFFDPVVRNGAGFGLLKGMWEVAKRTGINHSSWEFNLLLNGSYVVEHWLLNKLHLRKTGQKLQKKIEQS